VALDAVGIQAQVLLPSPGNAEDSSKADGALEVFVDDRSLNMSVEAVSYCTAQTAARLLSRVDRPKDALPLLVADRITAEARTILTDAGWSWLDRRGRLHLRGPGVRVDQPVPSAQRASSSINGPAVAGRSGITVAYWLCAHPGVRVSPNRHAAVLDLAPSTISTTVRRLAEAGLVDENGAAVAPELFWELAAVWRTERTWLVRRPDPDGHVPRDLLAPSWRMTGTAAAAAYGAPLTAAGEGVLDLYVTGPVDLSIATRRYGAAAPGAGSAVVAVPPTSLVTQRDEDDVTPIIEGWPSAPLVAVALDVAQDTGRGREILEGWSAGHDIWL
jgi:DNA-binding transcriptional ArsR family regulator